MDSSLALVTWSPSMVPSPYPTGDIHHHQSQRAEWSLRGFPKEKKPFFSGTLIMRLVLPLAQHAHLQI